LGMGGRGRDGPQHALEWLARIGFGGLQAHPAAY
jgi:hypothetical protein